jgi:hypothetical protein
VEKGRPQHPFQCVEAKVARFCFLPMPLGTETARARALTTLPADAHNVTQSRKICGSPRFALFRVAALEIARTKSPSPKKLVRSHYSFGGDDDVIE